MAVLTDPDGKSLAADCGLPVFVVADPRARLGEVASWVYGDPSSRLMLIGVTGTSGKTTTTYLLESGLRMAGHLTGLAGGVETRVAGQVRPSLLTTPEATDLQALLAEMVQRGVTAAAMEVSSHALALGRVAGTSYEVAVFTNLSQDHLDFHGGMDDYFAAKASLFTPGYARVGVVNIDDAWGRKLTAAPQIPLTTFSAAGRSGADWRATDVRSGADGSSVPGGRPRRRGRRRVGGAARAVQRGQRARRHRRAGRGRGQPGRRGGRGGRLPRGTRPPGAGGPRPGLHRAGGLLAQARRGRGGAARAPAGDPGPAVHRARLWRRPGPGQAPADGRGRRGPGRPGHTDQRQPALGGPAGHPGRDAAGRAHRACRAARPGDHRAGPGRGHRPGHRGGGQGRHRRGGGQGARARPVRGRLGHPVRRPGGRRRGAGRAARRLPAGAAPGWADGRPRRPSSRA